MARASDKAVSRTIPPVGGRVAAPVVTHVVAPGGIQAAQPIQTGPRDRRRLLSADLLAGGREAVIVHGQDEYRLRVTGNGKLILTK